ncbi:MAG: DUF4250 domain-containing protein [Lachnospiraceae bacterium]|nr:DUF4250 domain-containing protein [Lachnospiraceae bacterium]
MYLPEDPVMLMSVVNTELRDRFPTLERFCKANDVETSYLIDKLKMIDYHYDEEKNQFV